MVSRLVLARLFFFVAALVGLGSGPRAWAVSLGTDEVVVDRIDIRGEPGLARDFLKSTLDLPLGAPITRADFEERLVKFRIFLEASTYYDEIDLRLEKGTARGHYVVVAELVPQSPYYVGASLAVNRGNHWTPLFGLKANSVGKKAFVGSRSVGGTGLLADFELSEQDIAINGFFGSSESNVRTATLNLFLPDVFGSNFFAGIKTYAAWSRTESDLKIAKPDDPSTLKSHLLGVEAQIGRRWGLGMLSVTGGHVSQRPYDTPRNATTALQYETAFFGLRGRYSEKSFLAAIEPGLVVGFEAAKFPKNDMYYGRLEGLRTWLVAEHHALTPRLVAHQFHLGPAFLSRDMQGQVSFLYEWVSPWQWIFGIEPRWLAGEGLSPDYGIELTTKFYSPSMLVRLSFAAGAIGIDAERPDGSRGAMP